LTRCRLALAALGAVLLGAVAAPAPAAAHGLVVRADLPIPEWLFAWGAAVVLIVSFVALAVLWPKPRLEPERWRPLPPGLGRALTSVPVQIVAGAVGVALLVVVVWSGLAGVQSPQANLAPTFVYVVFWLGLVPISLLFGDVFRAFNPWRAIGRAVAWVAARVARGGLPAPLPYPARLGRWPAALALVAFVWLEIVAETGDTPSSIAIATLIYSAITFLGMALYGVDAWIDRAEGFSVYFNLISRVSPLERRGREIGVRPPLAGLAALEALPGTVGLLMVMIGSVSFDGLSGGPTWQSIVPTLQDFFSSLGIGPARTLELAFGVGLIATILIVSGFYALGAAGVRSVGGDRTAVGPARAFVHSLVPIAIVYAAAHYVSLLLIQGQAISFLASDPLGEGWNLLGTATSTIDYAVIGASAVWYLQVGFIVAGHVAALVLAHDRALVLYEKAGVAVRSQYWMLAVMVGFTTLALWLLSQANAG
jgi:hypothetical protein